MKTSCLQRSLFRWFRHSVDFDGIPTSMPTVLFFVAVVLQIVVTNTDQASMAVSVVRVVRVDVPPVVRSYDAKTAASAGATQPLLLRCAYALEGGENDDEDGDVIVRPTNATEHDGGRVKRSSRKSPTSDPDMDAAIEEVQHQRGVVVKWYFRRNPVPALPNNAVAIINDNAQVYQWIAGGGPQGGGPLGPLIGRAVDVTDETPRVDKSVLHRVIRVDRPTAELTGEYRCQVEDWNAERRSAWYPMVVYTPERTFKVIVDDNDDDDEDDIAEGSGGDGNSTTPVSSTSSRPQSISKKWPTEINITCYAAGMHPEPSMSIWVNGVMLDPVTMVVTEDDGDDDENNDNGNNGTTTAVPVTTTVKPKMWNRYRSNRDDDVQYKTYAVRANRVVSLKDAEEYRGTSQNKQRRRNTVDVECRLRVPGDGAGNGYWKADRPADRYYSARKSVLYKYRADLPPPPNDAFAAVSSASSIAEESGRDDENGADNAMAKESNGAAAGTHPAYVFVQTIIFAGIAVVAARH